MSGLFQKINGDITQEQVMEIAKTGVVPSNLKSVDDKLYYAIMKNEMFYMYSQASGEQDIEIDGEVLIAVGRKNIFDKIKEYLLNDGEGGTSLRESIVMVEGVDVAKSVSLYRFLTLCDQAYPDEAISEEFIAYHNAQPYDINNAVKKSEKTATGFGGNAGTLMNEEE